MKNTFTFLFACCLFTVALAQDYTRADLQKDLKTITWGLEKFHPQAYFYVDSQTVASVREELIATAPATMTSLEAYRRLNAYTCTFNDGHTRLWDRQNYRAFVERGGRLLPLEIRVHEGRLLIEREYGNNDLVGQEITAINGVAAADLLKEMTAQASRETEALDHVLLSNNFGYYLWLTYGWEGDFKVATLEDENKHLHVFTGVTPAEKRAESPRQPDQPAVSYRMLANQVAYLKLRHFEGRPKTFAKVFATAFASFKAAGARQLIIDARNHEGGDARVGLELARYLADEAFRPFAYSYWKATPEFKRGFKDEFLPKALHWAIPLFKGVNPHTKAIYGAEDHANARVEYQLTRPYGPKKAFTGEVFLLMDQNTFSAGTCFAAMFKDYRMGTIIGQESGNLANFHADGLIKFNLPVSQLTLQISNSYLVRPSGDESKMAVQPDVPLSIDQDALEYTLRKLAKK